MSDAEITLWTPITECGLSVRAVNALRNEGFEMIGQVAEKVLDPSPAGGIAAIMRLPNIGGRSTGEIMTVVRPLLSALPAPEDDPGFFEWCRENRLILELLRKHWHDPDFDEVGE